MLRKSGVALALILAVSRAAPAQARRPLARFDIDDIARLVMYEDHRELDSTDLSASSRRSIPKFDAVPRPPSAGSPTGAAMSCFAPTRSMPTPPSRQPRSGPPASSRTPRPPRGSTRSSRAGSSHPPSSPRPPPRSARSRLPAPATRSPASSRAQARARGPTRPSARRSSRSAAAPRAAISPRSSASRNPATMSSAGVRHGRCSVRAIPERSRRS